MVAFGSPGRRKIDASGSRAAATCWSAWAVGVLASATPARRSRAPRQGGSGTVAATSRPRRVCHETPCWPRAPVLTSATGHGGFKVGRQLTQYPHGFGGSARGGAQGATRPSETGKVNWSTPGQCLRQCRRTRSNGWHLGCLDPDHPAYRCPATSVQWGRQREASGDARR